MNTSALRRNYSMAEACDWLGITRRTLYKEVNSGRLKTFKIGTRRLVSERALEQFVKDREEEAA